MTYACPFQCGVSVRHDSHIFHEPGSPYAMAVAPDRRSATVWLADGTTLTRRQPNAVAQLRMDVREYEARMEGLRQREAFEDRTDWLAKQP